MGRATRDHVDSDLLNTDYHTSSSLVLVIYVIISRKDEIPNFFPKLVKFSGLIEFMGHK